MQDTLLASSALPAIYAPVKIGKYLYRDGGITDNLPIEPLYRKGIRNFIVIPLSPATEIPYDAYPNADFLVIRPGRSLGDDLTGTLDFTGEGAKLRMKLGYGDAVRTLTNLHSPESRQPGFEEQMSAPEDEDFRKMILEHGAKQVEKLINKDLKKLKTYLETVTGA